MIDLNRYGWNEKLSRLKQEPAHRALAHGRISVVHRTCYEVISGDGVFQCELTGNMMFGKPDFELPCTGDWVLFQPFDEQKGILVGRFPRERTLYRRKNNTSSMRVKHYLANPKACVYFFDKRFFRGVMLKGIMEVLTDAKSREEFWREGDELYYPEGITDPDYCVLKFTSRDGRYYSNFKSEDFVID